MPGSAKKEKAGKAGKKGSNVFSFFSEMSEERKAKARKVSGIVVAVFALFTFLAVVSYLFTWKADYSLLSNPDMMDKGVGVSNVAGKLGYRWGYFLVTRCFGLGSFAVVVLLFAGAARLFFLKKTFGMGRMTAETVSGAIILSLVLAYLSSIAGFGSAFGGGLGGDCGTAVCEWMSNLFGIPATGLVLAVMIVVWLLYVSGTFARWFIRIGEKERKPEVTEDSEDSGSDEKESPDHETVPATYNLRAADDGETVVGPEQPLDDAADDDMPFEPDVHEPEVPPMWKTEGEEIVVRGESGTVVTGEQGIEVVKGNELSTEVSEELPRIDVRSDLDRYVFPSLDLLDDYAEGRHEVASEELERNNNKIRATLLNYKIQIDKVVACVGPTVTLYKITPAPGVKISAIRNLEEDIAVALGARGVRVVTLADSVGIEVANDRPSIVPLKSLLNDSAFRESKFELPVAIGYTITQKVKTFDLTAAPHLLVAGATQQGKSVGLNVIISSLLYAKHPSELKFVFIDPKMVEFNAYAKLLKHYLAVLPTAASETEEMEHAIVKQPKQADDILKSLCKEMDERYQLMSRTSANNVRLYNEKYRDRHLLPTEGHRFLPYIVAVIDEYSDLVMSVGSSGDAKAMARSITNSIIRLAQKGRAAGIHVIIATQRPSVDVITGLIKTNFPMRIAFRTVTRVDSNTILDTNGAEKLIGKGDMLYYAGVEMERVQCALVSMDEIYRITNFIGSQNGYHQCFSTPYYLPVPDAGEGESGGEAMVDMQNLDDQFRAAAEMVVINQMGSTSTLQRKLGMGYARAGRVMDQLEAAGIVGPQDGPKPRQVLVSDLAELETILSAYEK